MRYRPETYVPPEHGGPRFDGAVEAWDDELPVPTPSDALVDAMRSTRRRFPPAVRHAARLVIFALAVLGALAGIGVAWLHVISDPLADTHAYYEAATRLNQGLPLYPANADPNGNHIYLYPPLLALVMRPFALLPFEWFALLWEIVVVASFVLLLRYLGVRRLETWLAVGLLGVPIGWALTIAQAHVPMTYLIALGQPWSIALAANIKLFPALIVIYWVGRRDFQSVFAFAIWSALLVLGQLALEPNGTTSFFRSVGLAQLGEVRNWSPYVQSPVVWAVLVFAGVLATLALARTKWGWAAAVTLATLAPPRLLVYMFTGVLAALRRPKVAGERDPDDLSDPAAAYVTSVR